MKIKTKKAAAKRFQITATGKVKFKKAGHRHNLGKRKSPGRKMDMRKDGYLFAGDAQHIFKCLPNGATR